MIKNIKIALRRQKKLIIIFVLTIFLPSVSLSIFGIRAIKSERFRLAKQIENVHKRAASLIKTLVHERIKDIETLLQHLVEYPAFSEKNYPEIKKILDSRIADNKLMENVFIFFKDEPPLFPLFQPSPEESLSSRPPQFTSAEEEKLKKAEHYEFQQKNYKSALSLYREIFRQCKDENQQAQILNDIARCHFKLKDYHQAIKGYMTICNDYPNCISSSSLPLSLIAHMQIIDGYRQLGNSQNLLKNALYVYGDILHRPLSLNENQFRIYSSMIEEAIAEILSDESSELASERYREEFSELKKMHLEKKEQWQVIHNLTNDIIPELRKTLMSSESDIYSPFRYSKTVNNRFFLILSVMIPGSKSRNSLGILGTQINHHYLKNEILRSLINDIDSRQQTDITISDLSGRILLGEKNPSLESATITVFFEDNFPPWRMDFFQGELERSGIIDLKNFYFWTILTMIVVLTFGAVLTVRTIFNEMKVLRIKSDFVSSVSHELRTPLTSTMTLIERLREGKVKNPVKMGEYLSMVARNTEKLSHLVKNILDFSKIDERKKEYDFRENDIVHLVASEIDSLKRDTIQREMRVRTQISSDIPHLFVDKEAISQAVRNLLDNAAKFSPGTKDITVSVTKDQNHVVVEVKDRGIGISQDEMDKIFDKFYRGKNALQQSVKGTGLGLTLVNHAVEAHGGKISVESKLGQGSTFSLFLPLSRKKE